MKQYFEKVEVMDALNPRNGFYGGRTNATQLYRKCRFGEKIKYVDVCSLYPFICKYGEFPVGHPSIITENFKEMSATERPYSGMVQCRILAPQNLYHPVLPYRNGDKLTFPLCKECADTKYQGQCRHGDRERELVGTWTTVEVYKALEMGYKLTKLYEVWHYKEWMKYDGDDKKSGMFTEYIDSFFKLKLQASGFPAWAKTAEDKERFVAKCKEKEGIELEVEKIEKNPGLRQVSKLCLNSFWGKFGQRNNQHHITYFTDPAKFFKLVDDDREVIMSVTPVNQEMVAVTHCAEENFIEVLPNTNVMIAAYTTAQARLHLYSFLEKLNERCLYFDTDSIVYLAGGDYEPPTGEYMGEMTNELEAWGENAYIEEFVSAGPKNYAFKVINTDTGMADYVTKVRGIPLTCYTSSKVNMKTMRQKVAEFVFENLQNEIPLYYPKIVRQGVGRQLVTKTERKIYRMVYNKRRVLLNFNTVPFGWKK